MIDDTDGADITPTPPDMADLTDTGWADIDQTLGTDDTADPYTFGGPADTDAGAPALGRFYPAPGDDAIGWPHPERASHGPGHGFGLGSDDTGFAPVHTSTFDHFNPDRDGADVIGTPAEDMTHWHMQQYLDSCDVVCEEFVLDAMGDRDYQEPDLVRESMNHGWYQPGEGTSQIHTGEILREHGIPVQQQYGCTLHDIADRLEHGEKVIVGIQPHAMDDNTRGDLPLSEYSGIPTQFASHAVEVIGIKGADTDHPVVILNDPGRPDGAGLMVPADAFERGWAPSGHFMTATAVHDDPETKGHDPVRFGGYYDENGTHHKAAVDAPRFGYWEKSGGYFYEYTPDGGYTGNWGT